MATCEFILVQNAYMAHSEVMTQCTWTLEAEDLDELALGARLLGSGGAGRTHEISLAAKDLLLSNGPLKIEPVSRLGENESVVAVGLVGSVIAYSEKPSGSEPFVRAYEAVRLQTSSEPTSICTYEIAGVNAFAGVVVASATGSRLLDIDGMGRAFSGLHQTSFNVGKVPIAPCSIVNSSGNRIDIHEHSAAEAEDVLRTFMTAAGGWAAFAGYAMTARQARAFGIPGGLRRAIEIGKRLASALSTHRHPHAAIENFCRKSDDSLLIAHGRVAEVDWRTAHDEQHVDRLVGSIVVRSHDGARQLRIEAQSEYLVLMENGRIKASVPDIIDLIDSRSGLPIPAEELIPGFAVSIIVISGPEIWKTPGGRQIVNLELAGYSFPHQET